VTSYDLGIDLGTTYSAAAVARSSRAEIVTLSDRAAVVPSVLFIREDSTILVGEPALRRGISEPGRVVREFKRRVGDPTPILVGTSPYSADALIGMLLAQLVHRVEEREGEPPRSIAVTYPANWGPYKTDLLQQAIRTADLGRVHTLTEPEATAFAYASTERLSLDEIIAVYDLGGGTFDAAVLNKTDEGFEILGEVEGIERLGGIDFDEAVFQHVRRALGGVFEDLDPTDPPTIAAVSRLRAECVDAKEALSSDSDVAIPVFLPTVQTEIRLTRAEFEVMIRPSIERTIDALHRALNGASVAPEALHAVLLVGGSSRIPLVSQMVSAALDRPVAVDAHPKHAVALGAALAAAEAHDDLEPLPGADDSPTADGVAAATTAAMAEPNPASIEEAPASPTPETDPQAVATPPNGERPAKPDEPALVAAVAEQPPSSTKDASGLRRWWPLLAGAAALVAIVAVAVVASQGSDAPTSAAETTVVVASAAASTTSSSTSTTTAATTSTGVSEPAPPIALTASSVTIDAITIESERYAVAYSADSEPFISNDPASVHLHFFFNTVPIEEAGEPGRGPWIVYDGPSPFTGYAVADRPDGATQLCTTAAGFDHSVLDKTAFHCTDLPDVLQVSIDKITIENERYAVAYSTSFTPRISSAPDSNHIHFFFDSVPIEDAGQPGIGPWILYDLPSPFTGYAVADRPDGATQMCAAVATFDHAVESLDIFHCELLPVVFTGEGNDEIVFEKPAPTGPFLVDTVYEGPGVFSVWGFDAAGEQTELIASAVGTTSATAVADLDSTRDTVGVTVESEGTWTITIRPFSQVDRAVDVISGDSDAVVLMQPTLEAPRAARIVFDGSGFISIWARSSTEGTTLLASSPDPLTDVVAFPADAEVLVMVTADGPWTLEVRSR